MLEATEVKYLSRFKENIELAKQYSDINTLSKLRMNSHEGDDDQNLRAFAKRLNIDTPKGSKKQELLELIHNSFAGILELAEKEINDREEAAKILQNLDATQTIGRRNIAAVASEIMPAIEKAFAIHDIDIERRVQKRETILARSAKHVALQERALYAFSTISDRKTQIGDRLLKILNSEEKFATDIDVYQSLVKRWISIYHLEFKNETVIYRRDANLKAQIVCENSIEIKSFDLYRAAIEAIDKVWFGTAISQDWVQISIAIALCTGRRMIEVHSLAEFEVVGEYELLFSGQAKNNRKTPNDTKRDNFVIPTLLPAKKLKLALEWLGNTKTNKGNYYRISKEISRDNSKIVNSTFSKALNGELTLKYFNIVDNKTDKLSYHGLRDIYASVIQFIFQKNKNNVQNNILLSKILGHSILDTQTANTYQKFSITDWGLIRDNINLTDAQIKELIKKNNW